MFSGFPARVSSNSLPPNSTFHQVACSCKSCQSQATSPCQYIQLTPHSTASLQVPYLLNLANELNTWMASFPPSPMATFSLLRKLDHCFASLLTGQDLVTKETLPGFENGLRGGMSTTDMVRCKSTVAQTRVLVVSVMSKEPAEEEEYANGGSQDEQEEDEAGMNSDGGMAAGAWDEDDERLHMDVARVYENTLVQLGDVLGEDFLGDL